MIRKPIISLLLIPIFMSGSLFRSSARDNDVLSDLTTVVSTDVARGKNAICALRDRYGFLWVGTQAGLACYDGNGKALYPASDGIHPATEGMPVNAIFENGDDIWFGGTAGVSVYSRRSNTVSPLSGAFSSGVKISSPVSHIARGGEDYLWILTQGQGIFIYNTTDGSITQNRSHGDFYSDMAVGSDGRVFAVTSDGELQIFDPAGRFLTAHPLPGTDRDRLDIRIVRSRDGMVIASGTSVYKFDPVTQDLILHDTVPAGSEINAILSDPAGNIVMATDSGLRLLDYSRHSFDFPGVTMPWLLPAGKISHISYDIDSSLIIVTQDSGVRHIVRKPEVSGEAVTPGSPASDDPVGISTRFDARLVKAYVQSISFPETSDSSAERMRLGLDVPLYTRDEIRLPYSDNTFTLTLSAARGAGMPPMRYDYMLEGVDKNWVKGASDEVTYAQLRPGRYTFMSRPANAGDAADISRLSIVILPPWYLSWMAFACYIIAGTLAALYLMVLFRRRLHTQYHNRMEALRTQKEHEAFEAKMRFFVNLVHEIRTPLTLISIPLEQLAESVENGATDADENRKHIASMRRNVNYLLGITNQLLDFRKAEEGREVKLLLGEHDLKKSLADICERFGHPMAALGKRITLVMPQGSVMARFDLDKTDRVIMNIIGNAVKYSRSRVDVTLHEPVDGKVSISVADDGPGIDPAERDHIFDTYYQIGGDNVAANLGTGLGLAYAKLIANAHGGNISVENNAEGGATFTLTLPVDEVQAAGMPVGGARIEDLPVPPVAEASPYVTVLLVDDNRELLATVADGLGKNYRVVTAATGEDALTELNRRSDIDVIVSDFMMPGMSGGELCRAVKGDQRFSHLPFIILTAKTDSDAKVEGMECGADVYMEKPFSIKQLNLQIANMLHTRELFHARMSASAGAGMSSSATDSESEEPSMNRLDAEFLRTLDAYIAENISEEEFSIDVMAKQMNMSRSSFYRKLKAVTGMTPVDYLKNYRLEYSAKLLLDGVRVTEVAVMAGFTSSSYFAKCFRARFGMIPKEYVAAHSAKSG